MLEIDIDTSDIGALFDGLKGNDDARLYLAQKFAEYMNPYVPYRTGTLADSATVDSNGITYTAPYASEVYYGDNINFNQQIHPLATSRWDEAAALAHMSDLENDMLMYWLGDD